MEEKRNLLLEEMENLQQEVENINEEMEAIEPKRQKQWVDEQKFLEDEYWRDRL